MFRRKSFTPFLSHNTVYSLAFVRNSSTFTPANKPINNSFSLTKLAGPPTSFRRVMSSTFQHDHFFSAILINSSGFPLPSFVSCPVRGLHTISDAPQDTHIPSSTTLTIGDVAVPIPDYVRSPERVSWVMPGIDHGLAPLVEAVATEHPELGNASGLAAASQEESLFFSLRDPITRSHLRWMCQKETLGQDMCLIGDQGPAMRWLVQLYSFLTRREVCTVYLNRDVTESDLKQRREIRNKSLIYEDQGAVTAAKQGQLLVLEGLERVERNVLPVINNLLENREMHLDNGQILIHPARYDSLLRGIVDKKLSSNGGSADDVQRATEEGKKELEMMGLLRVSENFRVVGITVPVPPYEGNPLDPPLRSRFQCLYVRTPAPSIFSPSTSKTLHSIAFGDSEKAENDTESAGALNKRLESVAQLRLMIDAVNTSTGDFRGASTEGGEASTAGDEAVGNSGSPLQNMGSYELGMVSRQLLTFPDIPAGDVLSRGFPWHLYAKQFTSADEVKQRFAEYQKIMNRCQIFEPLLIENTSTNSGRSTPTQSSRASFVSKQASDALKSMLGGSSGASLEATKTFITSGQLIDEKAKVPLSVEQQCNYFQVLKNVRPFQFSVGDNDVDKSMVIADAVVATVPRGKNKSSTFTLPIYMGKDALTAYSDGEVNVVQECSNSDSVFTAAHYHILQSMLQCHASRQHMVLIGPTGCGKTALIREFVKLLGYEKETTHLYADMTNKDFFQRRTTDAKTGNTTWENAALVEGAIHGKLVILDGIDKLSSGMLASLQQLLVDQNANLFDGTVLKPPKEYEILKEKLNCNDLEMHERKIFPIHPAFRVIATARPPGEGISGTQGKPFTVSQDVTTLFSVITMPDASETTLEPILLQVAERELGTLKEEGFPVPKKANIAGMIHSLLKLRTELESIRATDPKIPQLTFRQLLHLAKGAVRYPNSVSLSISSSLLLPLMSGVSAAQVSHALRNCGFQLSEQMPEETLEKSVGAKGSPSVVYEVNRYPVLKIDRLYTPQELALVPFVTGFYPNAIHECIIAWLAKQYAMKSNILLIGNQGVGKNKVVDTFLSRVQLPRHYIQLHRDTTVGSLTINPTVEGGKVKWEDSPLVKAVQWGHCLVVDEIDKAPVEVVQVLKGLIEDHEMRLGDGRQIVERVYYDSMVQRGIDVSSLIPIHPDFRMIVLANPPGFPFHGNDFFRECGDLFSSFVMGNPDAESQLRVLTAYAPNIPHSILRRLITAFEKLQEAFKEGNITYPFSLRELIAVVKHLSRYPQDGVYEALNNVFNFDARDDNTLRLVRTVLNTHLVQSIEKTGGMKNAFPFHVDLPKPHKPLPEALPVPLPKTDNGEFALTLPSNVIKGPLDVMNTILQAKNTPSTMGSFHTLCWKQRFQETDFAGEVKPHKHQNHFSDWFTDWTGTQKMPFIKETDTVLQVVPVGTFGDSRVPSGLVSVLLSRDEKLLLATVLLPPTPLEFESFVSVKSGMTAMGWPVGEVHFMDLTPYFAKTDQVVVEDFNFSDIQKQWRNGTQTWPPLSAFQEQSTWDRYASSPVALLRSKTGTLNMYLVDLLGGCAPQLTTVTASPTMSSPVGGMQPPAEMEGDNSHHFSLSEAVLPVPLAQLADVTPTTPAVVTVDPNDGLLSFVFPGSNTLYVWVDGVLTAVTLPETVRGVYFFSKHYATVEIGKEGKKKGVLKLVVRGLDSNASFAPLPDGVTSNIVDKVPLKADSEEAITMGPLRPEELMGTVWVEGTVSEADHVVRVSTNGKKIKGDIRYMVLEDYDGTNKKLEYRLFPKPPKSSEDEDSFIVDRVSHKLVGVQTKGNRQQVTAVLDTAENTVRHMFPLTNDMQTFQVSPTHRTGYAYSAGERQLSVADLDAERIQQRYNEWNTILNGSAGRIGDGAEAASEDHVKDFKMEYSTPRKKPSGTLKHGEVDDKEHHGGNTWAGGTGGTDTAGLGGLVGPYRLDKGNPVHQVSPEEKKKVPKHLIEEAKRMGKEALQQKLSEIGMSEEEYSHYRNFSDRVKPSVTQLRTLLQGLKAAEGERTWVKGQTDGVWDDKKIVEGIVGDKNVYKRRVDSKENNPFQHTLKKRVLFVLDVSASMYRFEGMDRRLSKMLESTIMVMEAFAGFESKIDYAMIGHNGDSDCIPLVDFGAPPANQRERLIVCQKMLAYSQYCWSGDNTVEAMKRSIDLVTAQKGDSYFVFVISDANLRQYGITPRELTSIIKSKPEVQMFCIFIATLGAQASSLQKQLPVGHGYECMRTDALPHILRQIFTSVNLL